ncbi:hypothetical protein ACFLZ0_00595 [Patescibacteria group bacterium]
MSKTRKEEIEFLYFGRLQMSLRQLINKYFQFSDKYFSLDFFIDFVKEYLFYRGFCIFGKDCGVEKSLAFFPEKAKKRLFDLLDHKDVNRFLIISDLYRDIYFLKNRTNQTTVKFKIGNIKEFDFMEYGFLSKKYNYLNFLSNKIQEKANDFIDYFLVHGSYASKDFIEGWSDLDTIIVLNNNVFQDENTFNRARNFFQRFSFICYYFDLLAHHRFFFVTNFDLSYYPQSILPLVVYENCFNLSKKFNSLTFSVREDDFEKYEILNLSWSYITYISQKKYISKWHFKKCLSIVLMLPSLLLQTKKIYVYKKYSFEVIKKEFSELDFNVIDMASQRRNQWKILWNFFYLNKFLILFLPINLIDFLHRLILYPYTHLKLKDKETGIFLDNIFDFSQRNIRFVGKLTKDFYEKN